MKTMTLRMPESLFAKLTERAKRKGATRSELVRRILGEHLDTGPSANGLSVLAVARDLAGKVRGPEDLSVNPEHLRGYGR